jgi:hypothetical protein
MGKKNNSYRILVEKPERKRPLGRTRHTREDSIKINVSEMGCGCVEWIVLAEDRNWWRALVNTVMNVRVP